MKEKSITKKRGILCLIASMTLFFALAINVSAANADSAGCKLLDGSNIQYTASFSSVPASDDGMMYLYQLKAYQYSIPAGSEPIASCPVSANPAITFNLDSRAANGRLYGKYALAVKSGGTVSMVANPQYISNPELIATNTKPRTRPRTTTQDDSLSNIMLTGNGSGSVPAAVVGSTAQILCNSTSTVIAHPYARGAIADAHPVRHQYYMLNAAEDAGIAALVADLQYYAANSRACDYLIGNEMNERIWNYMAWVDWDTYVREYTQAFRIAYIAIKSVNANANVYISLDQNWDRNRPTSHQEYYTYIDGKDFLEKFNTLVVSEGNIDWGIGIHPYAAPLTWAKFWDMRGATDGAYCKAQVDANRMLTFQNLGVFSSFITQPQYLSPKTGGPRDVIINEIGFSATQGDDVQAAAICASYEAFKRNPVISQYMYLSNYGDGVDARLSGRALQAYQAMGTDQEAAMMEWAKAYIGISDWSQVLR